MVRIDSLGISDRGLKRQNNEDVFVVRENLGMVLVADGMGGAAAGEIASHIFADTALAVFTDEISGGINNETLDINELSGDASSDIDKPANVRSEPSVGVRILIWMPSVSRFSSAAPQHTTGS